MKDTGKKLHGVPVFTDPEVPKGMMYMLHDDFKNGSPERNGMLKSIDTMTNQEILEKAIRKAADNRYKSTNFAWIPEDKQALLDYWFTADNYKAVIFNHEFARALWGEEEVDLSFDGQAIKTSGGDNIRCYKWQYYLQQMVISDDPIRYLGEHI